MRRLIDLVMRRRADKLGSRLEQVLQGVTSLADIGSGTGHNGEVMRTKGLRVEEYDVVDMHWVGPGPALFDGRSLPCAEDTVEAAALIFVLQYAADPHQLLVEARRLAAGKVIVVQSSYQGAIGRMIVEVREFLWGPVALAVARGFGMVGGFESPLVTRRHFTRSELTDLFSGAGLGVKQFEPDGWRGLGVSRDLYVLQTRSVGAHTDPATPTGLLSRPEHWRLET